jgi:hypothetical protein
VLVTSSLTSENSPTDWRELIAILLLSVTAILTAWTGFQASKWSGAMSISFSQASTNRIEAARMEATASRKLSVQVTLFTQWLEAYQAGDSELTEFLQARFPEPLATVFPVWLDSRPLKDPNAPSTPFEMEQYVIPESLEASAADATADRKFQVALRNNQRGDNYTVLTIGFAAVLFFAALSERMRRRSAQWAMLCIGGTGFVILAVVLMTFPKML